MYKLIIRKEGNVTLSNDGSVIIEDKIKDETIRVEIDGVEIKNIPNMKDVFSIDRLVNDLIFIAYNYSENTVFYDKVTLEKRFEINVKLVGSSTSEDDIYIYICYAGIVYKYNKQSRNVAQIKIENYRYCYYFCSNTVLFSEQDNVIHLCKILDNSVESVWRIDTFNDLFPKYNLKVNEDFSFSISEIKVYNGDFIVFTAAGIARLDAKTGKTVWKTEKRYCNWVTIVGQIGYISGGNKLSKINLETGQITGYGWEKELLPQIEYNGKKYWARGGHFVYNNDLLWHSVNMSGCSFIVAIDPKDGSYVWVEKVDSEHIYEPKFHDDKMYISDINSNLFIYQKQG